MSDRRPLPPRSALSLSLCAAAVLTTLSCEGLQDAKGHSTGTDGQDLAPQPLVEQTDQPIGAHLLLERAMMRSDPGDAQKNSTLIDTKGEKKGTVK